MLPQFDRSRLVLRPLAERIHDLSYASLLYPVELPPTLPPKAMADLEELGKRMARAREQKASVLMLMGAHVIRAGVQRQLIDLMEKGLVTHIGMNGAGPIHDYEMSRIGATCESVARYIRSGEFGLWKETGEINDIVRKGAMSGMGLGESIGKAIHESSFPYKETSVLAAGYRLGVPVTVHIGIGYDIIHEHPNFDPAAFGTASYRDFLAVCHAVSRLEGGVFLCLGSAVMGPEVYLKALAMARNVAHQEGRKISNFTTAAFDLIPIEGEWHEEAPKSNPQYYYRPWKTILVRTVADGGQSFYVCGDHRQTVPHLRQAALKAIGTARPPEPPAAKPDSPKPPAASAPPAPTPAVSAASSKPRAAEPPATQEPKAAAPPPAPKPQEPARKDPKPAAQAAAPKAAAPKPAPASTAATKPKDLNPAAAQLAQKTTKGAKSTAGKADAAPAAQLTRETILMRELAAPPTRKSEPVVKRRAEPALAKKSEPAPRKSDPAPRRSENVEEAAANYLQLKEWVRANDATQLELYEAGCKDAWQHTSITKDNFLRLYYRIVWTTGVQPRVVASKEDDYFQILKELLYPKGRFQPRGQPEFLMKVAAVLGGSADNRRNKAIVQLIEQIESGGWDDFRAAYLKPRSGLFNALQELPLIGPKEARLLLHQLGITDPTQDQGHLKRFAAQHGFADAPKCIQEIAASVEDALSTIEFVIWDSGREEASAQRS